MLQLERVLYGNQIISDYQMQLKFMDKIYELLNKAQMRQHF